ncbi:toxin glutamine deamidase domain-containing protein [Saccharopolyspora sp. NPDC002376]
MTNPLVAERKDSTQAFSGVPIMESVDETKKAIESGDWASGVMGAVGTGLDALTMALDPFGSILAAGVGWLMEHVGPLSDALDALTGDADQIKAHSETWKNVATELGEINTEMANMVSSDIADWTGDAADAYRQRSEDTGKLIEAAQKAAEGASDGIGTAGEVVAAVRTLVRDIIAELIGRLVSWALQVLATLGIAMAWVVPQVVAAVAKTVSKIADVTTKLVKAMKALSPLIKKLGDGFGDAKKALDRIKNDKGGGPNKPDSPAPARPTGNDGPGSRSVPDSEPAPTKPSGMDGPASTTPSSAGGDPKAQSSFGSGGSGGGSSSYGAPNQGGPPPPQNSAPPPPQNSAPPPPQVVSAQSFVGPTGAFDYNSANNFMQQHYPGVQQINKPNWDQGVPGHNTNCGYCTVATAHHLKGNQPYQVGPTNPMTLGDVENGAVQSGLPANKFQPVPGGYNQLNQEVAQQQPGFVASVAAKWPGDPVGHFFNVHKNPNGAVVYLDAQNGLPADISRPPSELYTMGY